VTFEDADGGKDFGHPLRSRCRAPTVVGTVGLAVLAVDSTERKRREADLAAPGRKASCDDFRIPCRALIFYKDRQHRLLRVNQEAVRVTGLTRASRSSRQDRRRHRAARWAQQYYADENEVMVDRNRQAGDR
jgi:PAS domain-containing protein